MKIKLNYFFWVLSLFTVVGLIVYRNFFLSVFLQNAGATLSLSNKGFISLLFSMLFSISAAKLFFESDQNAPSKSFWIYLCLSVFSGFYAAAQTKVILLGLFPVLLNGLIYFYIKDYSKSFSLKHIIAPLFFCIPFVLLFLFEPSLYKIYFSGDVGMAFLIVKLLGYFCLCFFLFALLFLSFMEVTHVLTVKNWYEMSLVAKGIALISAFVFLGILTFIQVQQLQSEAYLPFGFLLIGIEIPLILILISDVFFSVKNAQRVRLVSFCLLLLAMLLTPLAFSYLV